MWNVHRLAPPALALLLLAPLTAVGDPPPAPTPLAVGFIELDPYRAPPTVEGAVLAAPSDLVTPQEGDRTQWSLGDRPDTADGRRPVWVALDEPGFGPRAFTSDDLLDALRSLLPSADEGLQLTAEADRLRLAGPGPVVAAAQAAAARVLRELAPSVVLSGVLMDADREARLRAQGSARLWPGRWTRLWLQEQRPRYPVDSDIEIAQEATVMKPVLMDLPEGQELYARWLPGETRSLVELWSGDLEHLDEVEVDFTPIRNVPEASGAGPVRFPRTAVRRAYTACMLPAAGGSRELRWSGPGGARSLRLALSAAPGRGALAASGEAPGRLAWLRTGASASGLLFEARADDQGSLLNDLRSGILPGEVSLHGAMSSGNTLLAFSGSEADLVAAAAELARREAALVSRDLRLRVLTVPEEAVRAALADGSLANGSVLTPPLAERLRVAGAVEGEGVTLPLVVGVKAGLRSGISVPGLVALDVEVAQQAGGTDPVTGARFAGLAGEARLSVLGQGLRLWVQADLTWADPKGGSVALTFRPPVGMQFNRDKVGVEPESPRRVNLPVLTGGGALLDATIDVPADDGSERLLGVCVRGQEALLLLGSLSER